MNDIAESYSDVLTGLSDRLSTAVAVVDFLKEKGCFVPTEEIIEQLEGKVLMNASFIKKMLEYTGEEGSSSD